MRIMGLDVGSKTVGVAISDPLLLTAQGETVIWRERPTKLRQTFSKIEELIEKYEVTEVVVGYPKHMNGDIGDRAKFSEEFAETLERRTGLKVTLWDERLTTVSADHVLEEMGVAGSKRKEHIDKIAAVFILQGYLDYLKREV